MKKYVIVVGIISLFFILAITSMTLGYNVRLSNEEPIIESFNFDSYHISEITSYAPHSSLEEITNTNIIESNLIDIPKENNILIDGLLDSPWPMLCHDTRHTGRSPYSTMDNLGQEIWRFDTDEQVNGGIVIDSQGTIYVGGDDLYAVYPDGTLKWKYEMPFWILSTPAIDENGVIYVGTAYAKPDHLYAIYTSNGTLKWTFNPGDKIGSSPAIGEDGTIYFGCFNGYFYALNPNGTVKWKYNTGNYILSSPAIGEDGTVYCGSHNYYLFAFHPENGTVKWTFYTGYYVRVGPCIGDDGTIYCVSRDGYLYAVYPNNGTMKWQTYVRAGTTPTIGWDGTIYAGWKELYAINPDDGSVKWIFDLPDQVIEQGTPCTSIEGTIYFGTKLSYSTQPDGGYLIAVNPDGTEKWRLLVGMDWVDSPPAIGEDGTVYVGTRNGGYYPLSWGYLHAFGALDSDAPSAPDIEGPASGNFGIDYEYTFKSTSPLGLDVYYNIEWGDGKFKDWFGPFNSGEEATLSHKWSSQGTYTIKARAKDTDNLWGPWGELGVYMPRDKATSNVLFLRFLEKFPLLREVLLRLIPR